MIEVVDHRHSYANRSTRTDAFVGRRLSWRHTVEVLWILLNAPARLEGRMGSLEAGALSEDDRRLRALTHLR